MNHPELVQKYPTHLDLRDGVVRVGSLRFDVLEPPRTREEVPYTPC